MKRKTMRPGANAALSDAEHNATLTSMLRVFGDVPTTDEVVSLLSAGRLNRAEQCRDNSRRAGTKFNEPVALYEGTA
jgi:hypothetical protein